MAMYSKAFRLCVAKVVYTLMHVEGGRHCSKLLRKEVHLLLLIHFSDAAFLRAWE